MTLKLLPVLLVALGASSVNAADVVKVSEQDNAPAILNSVQSDSVQVLSKADAAKTRGEYHVCYPWACYGPYRSFTRPTSGWISMPSAVRWVPATAYTRGHYVSRKN